MYLENLINRRIMNTESKKIYKIRHLPKKYGDEAINKGHNYTPVFNMQTKKENVLHINKRNYNEYIVLETMGTNEDKEATKIFHDVVSTLN